jgi:hypothetical protein
MFILLHENPASIKLSKKLPRQNPTQGAGEIIKNREAE